MSIAHETAIRLMGIDTTIFGSILNPFVSSSKNLMRPPLDAGSGADFLSANYFESADFYIKTLLFAELQCESA